MPSRIRAPLLAASLALAGCGITPPAACGVRAVGTVPLDFQGGVPVLDVAVNGTPMRLILDTGAQVTAVSPEAAARARLPIDPHLALLSGIGGSTRRHFVRFDGMAAGSVAFRPFLGAMGELGVAALGGKPIDGLLGADVLAQYDIDLELRARRATFYAGRLCDPAEIPWGASARSLDAYRRSSDYDGRLYLPVEVNRTALTALLDTGAGASGMSALVAARLPPPREEVVLKGPIRVSGLGTRTVTVQAERFGTMRLGGQGFARPEFLIHRDLPPDMLLGDNYLGQERVWLSFSSGGVFVAAPGAVRGSASPPVAGSAGPPVTGSAGGDPARPAGHRRAG